MSDGELTDGKSDDDELEDPAPDSSETDIVFGEQSGETVEARFANLYEGAVPPADDHLQKTRLRALEPVAIASEVSKVKGESLFSDQTKQLTMLWLEMMMKGRKSIDGQGIDDIKDILPKSENSAAKDGDSSKSTTYVVGDAAATQIGEDDEDEKSGWW